MHASISTTPASYVHKLGILQTYCTNALPALPDPPINCSFEQPCLAQTAVETSKYLQLEHACQNHRLCHDQPAAQCKALSGPGETLFTQAMMDPHFALLSG